MRAMGEIQPRARPKGRPSTNELLLTFLFGSSCSTFGPSHVPPQLPSGWRSLSLFLAQARTLLIKNQERTGPETGPIKAMPLLTPNSLVWVSTVVLVIAVVYRNGLPEIELPNFLIVQILRAIFSDTYCYKSVKTLFGALPQAECFTIRNGRFTRVFLDETSFAQTKAHRTGHVIPGLWDGHGHLLQYGELMNSVSLFGIDSMTEVKKKLVEYKNIHPEAGTKDQWLRGVGWDQANFGGKWPLSVSYTKN
jgi:hypothetical protein